MSNSGSAVPQLTFRAVVLAIVLAVILAAANAYLGLFAGMTIATAIPAAVVSMGVLRLLGPTGGYLLSYPLAAFLAGRLAERGFDRRRDRLPAGEPYSRHRHALERRERRPRRIGRRRRPRGRRTRRPPCRS